ncbi:MAG: hypothetical protein WCB85_05680 [Candidatus Dormiibacterota bacterium]
MPSEMVDDGIGSAPGAGEPTAIGPGSTPTETIVRLKRRMAWAVAVMWLLDAALQAQPGMFTLDFISDIMKPSAANSPGVLGDLANWVLGIVTPHIAEWNWFFLIIQFVIAFSLLAGLGLQRERLVRAGLALSIAWGLGVWVFGEGTSGVLTGFTGNATMLTGAPGSVFLYMLIAVFYLGPDSWWDLRARFCLPRDALAIVFLYGFIAQVATPVFWGSQGLPVLIAEQGSMAPSWMIPSMNVGVQLTTHLPALWNAGISAAMLGIAVLLFGRRPRLAGFALLGITLAVIWYWGQAFGGIFDGMGTDPNTPPLFAILAVPAWAVWRGVVERDSLRRTAVTLSPSRA